MIEKFIKHLDLLDLEVKPPPMVEASPATISIDDSDSQVPFSAPPFYPDPEHPRVHTGFQIRSGCPRWLRFLLSIRYFALLTKVTI